MGIFCRCKKLCMGVGEGAWQEITSRDRSAKGWLSAYYVPGPSAKGGLHRTGNRISILKECIISPRPQVHTHAVKLTTQGVGRSIELDLAPKLITY